MTTYEPSLKLDKKRHIEPRWELEKNINFSEETRSPIVLHDCPYELDYMWAVDTKCSACKTIAPSFIVLAVKLGQAHTITTLLTHTIAETKI